MKLISLVAQLISSNSSHTIHQRHEQTADRRCIRGVVETKAGQPAPVASIPPNLESKSGATFPSFGLRSPQFLTRVSLSII